MIAHNRTRSPGGGSPALAFDYRVEPRRLSHADDADFSPERERQADDQTLLEALQCDLRTLCDLQTLLEALPRDVPTLLEVLQREVRGAGLALPRSENRALAAIACLVLPRMGAKLGCQLEFDLSERELAELMAVEQRTASRALDGLHERDYLLLIAEAQGNRARRWRIGPALLQAVLGRNVASMSHTTTSRVSLSEGKAPSLGDDASPSQEETENERNGLVVVRCIDETLAADAFTNRQHLRRLDGSVSPTRRHSLNESSRKIVVALAQSPCSPGELVQLTGYSRATIFRALDRLEGRGLIKRDPRRIVLLTEELERACERKLRRDELCKLHRGDRDRHAAMLERQEAAAEGKRHAEKIREARNTGATSPNASAFASPPAADKTPDAPLAPYYGQIGRRPAQGSRLRTVGRPCARDDATPDATPPAVEDKPIVVAPRSREIVIPSADALRESRKQLEALAARSGVRSVPDVRAELREAFRRRHEHDAPRCRHGEALNECGICAQSLAGVPAVTLGGRVLDPEDVASWIKQPVEPRTPLEIASEHAEIAARRREAA